MSETKTLTPRQRASQINGAKSRGPKTAEGKAKSAMNSLKHGVFQGPSPALDNESRELFEKRFNALLEFHEPRNPVEYGVVWSYASSRWRWERSISMETQFVNRQMTLVREDVVKVGEKPHEAHVTVLGFERGFRESKFFCNLSIYEMRLRRSSEKAERELNLMLVRRSEEEEKEEVSAPAEPEVTSEITPAAALETAPEIAPSEPTPENSTNEPKAPLLTLPQNPRNKPCPCGSGLKYKRCCLLNPPARQPKAA